MRFSTSVLVAAFAAISQVSAAIHFSSYPKTAVPSTPTTLEWTGGDNTNTITITLKKAGSIVAVLLQRNGQATSFDWTPAGTLASGSDYTLEITQGTDTSDTPEFTVGAASTSSSADASATSASATSASATTTAAIVTSLSTVAVTTTAAPVTTVAPVGNITSSGSILPISTFTTLPGNATSTGGSGSNGTATGSSLTPTNTINPSSGASSFGSSLTLLVGAAAAIVHFC